MSGRRLRGLCALALLAGVVALAMPADAERQPFDRYQSIVDRQMFGPLPPNFDPTKSPAEVSKGSGAAAEKELTKEQEKVKSAIRFSVINVTPNGETAIGFTDNSDPKAPKHYYLKEGESRDGWEVKEANAKEATMTIAKDGVEVSLKLGGDSSKEGAATQAAQPAGAPGSRRSPMLGTLGSRRRARQEREAADQREAAKREAEAKAREEERARREEEDKAQRAAEREEQRRQLMQIQEELRKAREARQAAESESKSEGEASSDTE